MVAARPTIHRQRQRKTKSTSINPRTEEISYFFLGRQGGSPYVYDRHSSLTPSNVLWLFEDHLDQDVHDGLYRREILESGCEQKVKKGKGAGGTREKKRARRQEKGVRGKRVIGEIIDLTISDEEEDEVVDKGSVRPAQAGKFGRGDMAAASSCSTHGGAKELRATFTLQNGPEIIYFVTG